MTKVISSHDPRDATLVNNLIIAPVDLDDLPPDYYSLVSLVFAFLAVFFRIKAYSWITCLLCFASLANQRYSASDSKGVVATFSLITLTFLSTHVTYQGQPILSPMFPSLRKNLHS